MRAIINGLGDAYALLKISADATDAEVKLAYRRLMNQHHPDKLMAKGLSEDRIREASHKAVAIRDAYERIRKHRSL